jgi:hypothetical protein
LPGAYSRTYSHSCFGGCHNRPRLSLPVPVVVGNSPSSWQDGRVSQYVVMSMDVLTYFPPGQECQLIRELAGIRGALRLRADSRVSQTQMQLRPSDGRLWFATGRSSPLRHVGAQEDGAGGGRRPGWCSDDPCGLLMAVGVRWQQATLLHIILPLSSWLHEGGRKQLWEMTAQGEKTSRIRVQKECEPGARSCRSSAGSPARGQGPDLKADRSCVNRTGQITC